jgi:uncharacterized protein YecE (DUF72 family)
LGRAGENQGVAVLVGTSGWQYNDWRGRFYPKDLPKAKWLPYFSAAFPTVEVNNTFYTLPREETFVAWREASADGFVITIKASRYITHIRRLRDCRDPLQLLWSRCERLREKLGPVLFQLPPNLKADNDLLRGFLRLLPKAIRAAFEFRHDSWETEETYGALDDAGCALVLADRPGARVPEIVTGGWGYIRFHKGTLLTPGYRRPKLRRWADRIARMAAWDTFVYFNNDTGGAAVRDARTFTELLAKRA